MVDPSRMRDLTELDFQVFQQLPGLVSNKLYACSSGLCTDSGTSCIDGTTLHIHGCPTQPASNGCYTFKPESPAY